MRRFRGESVFADGMAAFILIRSGEKYKASGERVNQWLLKLTRGGQGYQWPDAEGEEGIWGLSVKSRYRWIDDEDELMCYSREDVQTSVYVDCSSVRALPRRTARES